MFGVKIFELLSDKVRVMYHSRSSSLLELCREIALNGPRCHYLTDPQAYSGSAVALGTG